MTTCTVRAATSADIGYVMALQRANRESVGGLPEPAIMERIQRQTLLMGSINGDPVGYIMWDARPGGLVRIPQACIQYDARRRQYGEAIWLSVLQQNPSATEVRLRCAADIEANLFWRQMGFVCTAVVKGGSRRGRWLNVWRQWFGEGLLALTDLSVIPAAQSRVDCKDEQTDFMSGVPAGFVDMGTLPKLAWSNRKDAGAA